MKLITLLLFFVTHTLSLGANNDDCAAIAAELKRDRLYDEFHEEELLSFCNKKNQWETVKIKPLKNHTTKQSAFLQKIWKCRSVDCFGSDWRKRYVSQINDFCIKTDYEKFLINHFLIIIILKKF